MSLKTCHICNSKNAVEIDQKHSPFIDECYTLYECGSCKSQFFDLDEHKIDLESHYNKEDKSFNSEFKLNKHWSREVKEILKLINIKNNLKVLDVGCRTGDFLMHLPADFNKTGIELNNTNAQIAQGRGISIFKGYVQNFKSSHKYNIVTCYALLEHIPHPKEVLKAIGKLVKRDGILVLMVPNHEGLLKRVLDQRKITWHMYSPPEHVSFYSFEFMNDFFSKNGFKLVKKKYRSGGIAQKYFIKYYNQYLTNTNHKLLHEYVSNVSGTSPSNLFSRVKNQFLYYFFAFLEKLPAINKRQIMDHMYLYFRKI